MAMSINPVVDASSVKRGVQFANYKTNTNKYLEYTDTTYQHDVCHAEYINEEVKMEFDLLSIDDKEAKLINEAYDYQPLSEFGHYFQEADFDYKRANEQAQWMPKPKMDPNNPNMIKFPYEFETDKDGNIEWITTYDLMNYLNGKELITDPDAQDRKPLAALPAYMSFVSGQKMIAPSNPTFDKNDVEGSVSRANKEAQTNLFNSQQQVQQADAKRRNNPYFKAADAITVGAQAANATANAITNIASMPSVIKSRKADAEKRQRDLDNYDADRALKQTDTYARMKTSNISYVNDKLCEKMNTMKPLLMKVTLNMLNKDDSLQPIEYVVGVKCHTRMVQASILPEVAQFPLKEMDKISRKVKWRAGELKFFKDLVFRIKEKKQTAADSRDPNRKWYRRLYELAHMKGDAPAAAVVEGKSLFKTFIKDKQGKGNLLNGMIPNASIIMSQTDVDNIKARTDIDLLNPSTARKFCGELFLMSLVIIDIDRESIKILLPDMNNDYDVHSLAAVNKQLATLDTIGSKTRDVFKLLN